MRRLLPAVPILQAAFTFHVVFFLHFSENLEIRISDTFFVCLILLVYKMLIGKKLYFSPVYVSPKISLIIGIISFWQSFKIVRNSPSYILAIYCPLPIYNFILSSFQCKFKQMPALTDCLSLFLKSSL